MTAKSQTWRHVRRWLRRVWVAAGLSFCAWLTWNAQAHGVADELLASDSAVYVQVSAHAYTFTPRHPSTRPAVIFLPGGTIDPKAYVPLMRQVATAGHPAAVVSLPYRMAPTEATRLELWRRIMNVKNSWQGQRSIVLAGHSRGAALASGFAADHPAALDGLVLIGTTHPRNGDLSRLTMPIVKIVATRDCVAPPAAARAYTRLLPSSTRWVEIAGGNHAQFGYYGSQLHDCSATITRDAQQAQLRASILSFLDHHWPR
jgi:pimeloyl-ACP methyl ester carboxylesterase